jgi:hypothetical protein
MAPMITTALASCLVSLQSSVAGNLLTDSESAERWGASPASWSVTPDVETAPDGMRTADLVRRIDATPAVLRRAFPNFTGQTAAFGTYFRLPKDSPVDAPLFVAIRNDTTEQLIAAARLDLSDCSIVATAGSASTESVSGGWCRACVVADRGITPGDTLAVYYGSGHDDVELGHGFLVWGMQLSSAAECGSYIGTQRDASILIDSADQVKPSVETGPPVTRSGDAPPPAEPLMAAPAAAPPVAQAAHPSAQQTEDPPAPPSRAQEADLHAIPATPAITRLLYAAWLAELFVFTLDPDIPDEGYEAAMELARRTALLAPDRRAAWDLALVLADQIASGNPNAAASVRAEALAALARIDPADDVVRLSRIGDAIESHSTAEGRVRAYETMLDAKHRASIGAPVASRLAYQLASLESRMGNTDLFARWLGDSVKTDPSFPAAAQSAAGFFRMRVNDPAADVELLSIALEANPRNLSTWSALITVLLDGAAFKGAERVARMAIAVADAERRPETVYSLTGDLATALWGTGQRDAALRELNLRMGTLTDEYRRAVSYRDPSITLERLNREFPPLPSTLAIAMLGLRQATGDTTEVAALIDRASRGTDAELRRAQARGEPPEVTGGLELQRATTILLFGADVSGVPEILKRADDAGILGPQAKARFDAMIAWRQGKAAEAVTGLEPIREGDPLARYAYASALLDLKRTQEGAAELRALAQEAIGTSIGLLALDRLSKALGQDVIRTSQLSKEIGDRAAAMEAALARSLPTTLDRMVENPVRSVVVDLRPTATSVKPYDPLTLTMRLRNNSQLPLAIGQDSPIAGKIMLRTQVARAGETSSPDLPPQPILIDRRLRLMPGEELTVDVDAELTTVGLFLNLSPLDAHALRVSVVTNPAGATGGMAPGFLGTVTGAPPLMSTGVNLTEAWVREGLGVIKDPANPDAPVRMALLAHAAAGETRLPETLRAERPQIWTAIADAWKALHPQARAWVVSVLPRETPAMAPLLDAARADSSKDVLTSWLISRVGDPNDPMLDVCRRSGDMALKQFADATEWVLKRRAARAVEEVGLEGQRPSTR